MKTFTRLARISAVAAASALALTACGGGGGTPSADGEVTLRFSWWGSESRAATTQKIIEAFEAENPGIKVKGEFGDWGGYWDKLATQVASNDAPDIIQMDDKYLREYADRGALLDLEGVDVSKFDEAAIENGRTDEGLFGITTGINAMTMVANPAIFEAAGVPLPDDETWTWDDFADITRQITENVDGKYGATGPNEPAGFQFWLRQHGKSLTTAEGELGFEAPEAVSYLEMLLGLMENGSTPSASGIAEDQSPGPDQSLTGTGVAALGMWWTNQLNALSGASGEELVPLRFPGISGEPGGADIFYKSSMFMSATNRTRHPEEVKKFIDFMVNSEEAAMLNLADRGLPSNLEVREKVVATLEGADARSAEFIADIEDEVGEAEAIPPIGFSGLQDILYRYELEVFFKRQTPEQAAENMINEMRSELS
ncbi:ABC transporter substrate-binding protein [Zafaria sp. Z1313]|uniref:ABC transporter substrate-binding protein n=1 Tax=Zafaria sp. Z1313 TaxID=3423202 RepID=UPI003D303399